MITLLMVELMLVSVGVASSSVRADVLSKGMTDMMMRIAMNTEHIGSAMRRPKCSTNIEDIITPTLPRVSANMWRYTPDRERERRRERERERREERERRREEGREGGREREGEREKERERERVTMEWLSCSLPCMLAFLEVALCSWQCPWV